MKSFLLTWMWYNAVLGAALLMLGCATAAISKSPVRRLRLLEWTPCAFGLKRWRVLLPVAMTAAPQVQAVRFALAHELSHLDRGDLWTWRLTRLAQATLWFQPAVGAESVSVWRSHALPGYGAKASFDAGVLSQTRLSRDRPEFLWGGGDSSVQQDTG
jgi:Zn-dependent protease with chaperone function